MATSVTPELLALVEARKKREAAPMMKAPDERLPRQVAATFAMIDKAAPFMDDGCPSNKWPPSVLLKLTWYVARSCGRAGADREALLFILQMLDRARKLWVASFHPNPFCSDEEITARARDA